MLNIAITGGIASGKSTACDYLIAKGYTVIDADAMAREITSAGGKAMPYILENFGRDYVNEDGSLNRAAMRDLVFRHPDKLKILEAGTTSVVLEDIEKIKSEKQSAGDLLMFFDIPLLFEKHQENNYDAVWVITSDISIRRNRLMLREGIEENMAELMMDNQENDDVRIAGADFVIYNNGDISELHRAIDDALEHYI